jgi:hypothetical protein
MGVLTQNTTRKTTAEIEKKQGFCRRFAENNDRRLTVASFRFVAQQIIGKDAIFVTGRLTPWQTFISDGNMNCV